MVTINHYEGAGEGSPGDSSFRHSKGVRNAYTTVTLPWRVHNILACRCKLAYEKGDGL